MKLLKLSIVIQALGALLLTEALSVASLFFLKKNPTILNISAPILTAVQFLIVFFFAAAIILLFLKLFHGRVIFEIIFSLAIFSGVWFLAGLFLSNNGAIILASVITLARLFIPYIFVQNLIMILGIAGIAVTIGAPTSWQTIMIILVLLSVYDIVAVYETKHMVAMFKGLMERGVIFALIIPEKIFSQFTHLRHVKPSEGFFFLGSGDLALPTVFVVSAFIKNPILGLGAAIGSLLGLCLTDLIFVWNRRRPMPALPPIALGAIAGFFVGSLIMKLM